MSSDQFQQHWQIVEVKSDCTPGRRRSLTHAAWRCLAATMAAPPSSTSAPASAARCLIRVFVTSCHCCEPERLAHTGILVCWVGCCQVYSWHRCTCRSRRSTSQGHAGSSIGEYSLRGLGMRNWQRGSAAGHHTPQTLLLWPHAGVRCSGHRQRRPGRQRAHVHHGVGPPKRRRVAQRLAVRDDEHAPASLRRRRQPRAQWPGSRQPWSWIQPPVQEFATYVAVFVSIEEFMPCLAGPGAAV